MFSTMRTVAVCALLAVAGGAALGADDWTAAKQLVDDKQYDKAIELLIAETEAHPANDDARILLAQSYEGKDQIEDAIKAWEDLLKTSFNDENKMTARKGLCRLRRIKVDRLDREELINTLSEDERNRFYIEMPDVQWEGLEVVEDDQVLEGNVPPFIEETEHFIVASHNERLSKVIGERSEIYLDFMSKTLFGGREWAVRFPILCYSTHSQYASQGGAPPSSHGVTQGSITGRTANIKIFQLDPEEGHQGELYKYAIESILPHELTHAMLNEFFGGRRPPQWLHEAVAGRFEQTREHYTEAAKMARAVVAGEHFRMRDLFEQKGYPQRVGLFYEQSANVVLYLFEAGPEAMYVFLDELARTDNDHDAACAAVLGLPKEGAVEEFEKRWIEWMKLRYIKDLSDPNTEEPVQAVESNDRLFRPSVNELDTVAMIENWRDVDLSGITAFADVGGTRKDWSAEGGKLVCNPRGEKGPRFLGIRMNEVAPLALTCEVRFLGGAADDSNWFGFTLLDAEADDTTIEVLAPVTPGSVHQIVGILADDLAIYVDGKCTGRYPAFFATGNQRDLDYPVALVSYGSVEVEKLRVAAIAKFSDKPLEVEEGEPDSGRRERPSRRPRGRRGKGGGSGPPIGMIPISHESPAP